MRSGGGQTRPGVPSAAPKAPLLDRPGRAPYNSSYRELTHGDPMTSTLPAVVDLGKALGHPARLRILAMLRGGPLCVCQITAVLELAASTVSAHLLDLRRGGLVTEDKQGKWVHYALTADPRIVRVLEPTLALFEGDERVRADAKLVAEVRRAPLVSFCRVGFRPGARRRAERQAAGVRRTGRARASSR